MEKTGLKKGINQIRSSEALLILWKNEDYRKMQVNSHTKFFSEDRKCKFCDIIFTVKSNSKQVFCSKSCATKYKIHIEKDILFPYNFKGTFKSEYTKYKISNSVSLNKHPNWRGGLSFEPYGIEFNLKLKEIIRSRDGYRCRHCGITEEDSKRKLVVHHIDYDKKNNLERNLISLCNTCHSKTNYNRDFWRNLFNIFSQYWKIGEDLIWNLN